MLLLSAPAQATDDISDTQRQAIERLIHKYILDNPEVILESVQRHREKAEQRERADAQKNLAAVREQLENDPGSPVGGNPNGDVTVVEFFDYRCGYCKRVHAPLMEMIKEDGNVRLVYKEFPILGPESMTAAKAALAAWQLAPEKYAAYHDALMSARGEYSKEKILSIAAEVGIDSKAISARMDSDEIETNISLTHRLAQTLGITGTPAFVIGDELVPGAIDKKTLKALVKKARSR